MWLPSPHTILHRSNKRYIVVRSDGSPHSQKIRHRNDLKRFYRPTDFSEPRIILIRQTSTQQADPTTPPQRPMRRRTEPNRLGDSIDSRQLRFRLAMEMQKKHFGGGGRTYSVLAVTSALCERSVTDPCSSEHSIPYFPDYNPRLFSRNIVGAGYVTVQVICELCLRFTSGYTHKQCIVE